MSNNDLNENTVRCIFLMVVIYMLSRAEIGPNDHQKDAPHFK